MRNTDSFGSLIRFRCQGDAVLTRVTNVARYTNFEEMFDHESISSVNPLATRAEQLANSRAVLWRSRSPAAHAPTLAGSPVGPSCGSGPIGSGRG